MTTLPNVNCLSRPEAIETRSASDRVFRRTGQAASEAMRAELQTTPKPGLVDGADCGAHRDMNYALFEDSIAAIRPYLLRMAREARARDPSAGLFETLRRTGLEAERAMFAATGGVNTHKGQIFVLTLLIAATGSRAGFSAPEARAAVRLMTRGMVERELRQELRFRPPVSHGEKLFQKFGVAGVRGEAEAGFPVIFETGLPVYRGLIGRGLSPNDAAAETLLHIICAATDSTVLHRGGMEAHDWVRQMSRKVLTLGGPASAPGRLLLQEMNQSFIERGISPGGSADLLAGTLFLYSLEEAGGHHGRV